MLQAQALGRAVHVDEVFAQTHVRKGTNEFVDERSRKTHEDFSTRLSQVRSEHGSAPTPNDTSNTNDDIRRTQCWVDVVGGKKKGRVYGAGQLAANYTTSKGGTLKLQGPGHESAASNFRHSFHCPSDPATTLPVTRRPSSAHTSPAHTSMCGRTAKQLKQIFLCTVPKALPRALALRGEDERPEQEGNRTVADERSEPEITRGEDERPQRGEAERAGQQGVRTSALGEQSEDERSERTGQRRERTSVMNEQSMDERPEQVEATRGEDERPK
ncbi:hypothetical protein LR48_Vigan425s000300 [Vigna angularis]|uniref:Uncharacterized protein n=1 Tax=Phaseolus angularis TaxID=3914 RepID=A0A0L9TAT6_PHAAN|nr:hypothetical protein LR48_Vigan425s000300 [Vigna angularis]